MHHWKKFIRKFRYLLFINTSTYYGYNIDINIRIRYRYVYHDFPNVIFCCLREGHMCENNQTLLDGRWNIVNYLTAEIVTQFSFESKIFF